MDDKLNPIFNNVEFKNFSLTSLKSGLLSNTARQRESKENHRLHKYEFTLRAHDHVSNVMEA